MPKDFTLAGVNGVSSINALDATLAVLLKGALDIAGKLGAFDQVVLIHSETVEKVPFGFIGGLLSLPAIKTTVFYAGLYDVKSSKIIGAAMKEYRTPSKTFIAQYPLNAKNFSNYLLNGN